MSDGISVPALISANTTNLDNVQGMRDEQILLIAIAVARDNVPLATAVAKFAPQVTAPVIALQTPRINAIVATKATSAPFDTRLVR